MEPKDFGKWEPEFQLSNDCIHASLLPVTGNKILYWGRRKDPRNTNLKDVNSMNEHQTSSFILDLNAEGKPSTPTANAPRDTKGNDVHLFCSGHTFQPDGKLLVVGGHWTDGERIDQACIFSPFDGEGRWESKQPMGRGRWYPSAIKLPDGNILVLSGSKGGKNDPNPQLWCGDKWKLVKDNDKIILYPRLCIDPKDTGAVFMSGPMAILQWLQTPVFGSTNTVGIWDVKTAQRGCGQR
jgi:galactose oxidase